MSGTDTSGPRGGRRSAVSLVRRGGGSSVGRAPGCGPGGRGFESRPPPTLVKVLASRPLPGPAWALLTDVEYADGGFAPGAPRDDVEALVVVGDRVDGQVLDMLPGVR